MSTRTGSYFSLLRAGSHIKVLVTIVLAAAVLSVPVGVGAAAPPQAGPTTWTVLVGGQAELSQQEFGPAGAWQFMRFYPENLTINVGDMVVWKLNSAEPHTVTFPKPGEMGPPLIIPEGGDSQRVLFNPLAALPQGESAYDGTALTSSGQIGGDPQFPAEYKLTFTKEGTFEYICAFHPMMMGKVIVQAAGAAYPKAQAQIDADAAAQMAADSQAATMAEPGAMKASTRSGSNGTTIHEVYLGYGDGVLAWMRFSQAQLTINAGDTVEWIQADVDTPHTVTFTSGDKEPQMVVVEPQQAGPPKLVFNPMVVAPAGGSTYSGTGYFNSGLLWGTKAPQPGPRTYSLTFNTPGVYKYVCALHDTMGMVGEITVLAEGAPTPAAAEALKAVDKDGLPVPDDYTSYIGDNSPYRQGVNAVSPSPLKAVLDLYRRELTARKWNELPSTVEATDTAATLMFANADKQSLELKLTQNADGGTEINLVVKSEAAAREAGVLPPAGQARIYLGNMTDGPVVFAIDQKEIKVDVEAPTQTSTEGVPFVDVSPGQHDFTLTMSGKPPVKDSIQVGADETWALVAGPGGALPLQMY